MKRAKEPNPWMKNLPQVEYPQLIREVFDFLCRDCEFQEPVIKQTSLTLRVAYLATRVAVEIDVDFRDQAVEVGLVWLLDGKRPEGWKIDTSGRQFMTRLYEAAWLRKLPNPRVTIPASALPATALQLWLQTWANQLREQFADVLHDCDTLFQELNKARERK